MFRPFNRRIFYKTAQRLIPSGVIIPFIKSNNENDYNLLEPLKSPAAKTGWDRVKEMYSTNDSDEVSLEMHNVLQASMVGVFFGVIYGGFMKSRDAYLYFLENNQATIFKSTFEAKKKLQDYVTIAFAKGGYKWGWRLGFFTGLYSLVATTISVYRDKNSVLEYVVAGTITGAIYKCNLGLAASMVGAGLGAALSLVGGICIIAVLKISGVSMADIRKSLYTIKETRQKYYNKGLESASSEKNDALTRNHDEIIEAKGEKTIEQI
ncbi:RPII140-upstream gene protein [Leptidea sinapis]|uniref:Complex I assembly factor TIMMDC1, mitochondrial n=1 Tax=Leptidea sinapis TaxID=189913 RepID=A0A5E4QFW3_9NEOP|nr:RPII140-upstream gene protein [Leptidea sinapis]VVC96416.1 unnamed protein product [Leptidea sinapis]